MSWKSALVAGTMALASQTALANKPLPCPTSSPLVDTANVVQADTRKKIEARLWATEREKHHQVVVLTVDNIEDYGYKSIFDMAQAYGGQTGCKVGYAGSNTGVVIIYSKKQAPVENQSLNSNSKRIFL